MKSIFLEIVRNNSRIRVANPIYLQTTFQFFNFLRFANINENVGDHA